MNARMPDLSNAACRQADAAPLFETVAGSHNAAAKQICGTCWDRRECLAWGLEHEEFGIWGGHGIGDLRALRSEFGISINNAGSSS